MDKVSNLTLLVAMAFLAVGAIVANEWWKDEPNIYTAAWKAVVVLILTGMFSIWYYRSSLLPKLSGFVVIPLLVLGVVSNSVAVLANNGLMPADPALGAAGLPKYYIEGGNLPWLGDCLWMGNSIGDLMFFSGMIILLLELIVFVVRDYRKKVKS